MIKINKKQKELLVKLQRIRKTGGVIIYFAGFFAGLATILSFISLTGFINLWQSTGLAVLGYLIMLLLLNHGGKRAKLIKDELGDFN